MLKLLRGPSSATCRLTEVEVSSALARRRREGDLSLSDLKATVAALRADLITFRIVELSPDLVAAVHALLQRHPLRAGDALQLAAAIDLRDGLALEKLDFVCFDDRLSTAAAAEGFTVRP